MKKESYIKKNGRYFLKYAGSESYYKNSLLLECIIHFRHCFRGKLLDLGCGNKPYSLIYNEICESSVGCDVPESLHTDGKAEILCRAEEIDRHFGKESLDCVLCTEVLEHTGEDRLVVKNINTILKEEGRLLISVPFIYVLHEEPYDFRRYTVFGITDLLTSNGFVIESVFSAGATFSSSFFVMYYSFTKIFYYAAKKAGLKDLHKNKLVSSVVNLPELIFHMFAIFSFRKKLRTNKPLSKNEMFSSLGYFISAKKSTEVC